MSDTAPADSPLIIVTDDAEHTRQIAFEVKMNEHDLQSPRVWMYITASKETGEITCAVRKHGPRI